MSALTVADVLRALDTLAPPHLALDDDPHGLLVGDPAAPVTRVAVALDVTRAVAEAAQALGAEMIVAHHPLVYHPLRAIRQDDSIGAVVLACARARMAVACAHTSWDVAPGGINDVLARLLGLSETRPLRITYREPLAKIVVFVPSGARSRVLEAMAAAGAGAIGDYDRCAFWTPGTGTFRPLPGAQPYLGTVGQAEETSEDRLEMIAPEPQVNAVVAAMKAVHPYEEVAYDILPLTNTAAEFGIGRVGTLPEPLSRDALVGRIAALLDFPPVRAVGSEQRVVRTVAVCGGAGAFLLGDALAGGADALVTADVRHHEFVEAEARGLLLIDAGHAATETPGTQELARQLARRLASQNVALTFLAPDGQDLPEASGP